MFQIQKLSNAVEAANRLRLKYGADPVVVTELKEHLGHVDGVLLEYVEEVRATRLSNLLSEKGKEARIGELREEVIGKLAGLDRSARIASKVEAMTKDLTSRVASRRKENQPKDATLAAFQQGEIRRHLENIRTEAKAQHDALMNEAREAGRVLSDQERQYSDPVEQLFLEACATYDPAKELFLGAVTSAPWPMNLLPGDIIAQGEELLKATIAPDLAAAVRHHTVAAILDEEASQHIAEVVAHPEKQAIQSTPRIARPDRKEA